MLNSYKALKSGDLGSVDPTLSYPLLRWCSGSETDHNWCAKVNLNFWWVPKELIVRYIWTGLRDRSWSKYPKVTKKSDDKKDALRRSAIMTFYGWSEQEYQRNSGIVDSIDITSIADVLGLSDGERKTLGLTITRVKTPKVVKKTERSLFDFKKK